MKNKISLFVLTVLLLAACAPKAGPTPAGTLPPVQSSVSTPASGEEKIDIQNFTFSPATLTITVGTKVTWTNQDTVGHTVIADDNSWGSGNLNQGDTFSFAFSQPGTFAYHCSVHPNMKGTITVVAQ
jgi:plastocyanin